MFKSSISPKKKECHTKRKTRYNEYQPKIFDKLDMKFGHYH